MNWLNKAKYRVVKLPNGMFLFNEKINGYWQYPEYNYYKLSATESGAMYSFDLLKAQYWEDRGSKTMKEAVIKWFKVLELIKTPEDFEVIKEWLTKADVEEYLKNES